MAVYRDLKMFSLALLAMLLTPAKLSPIGHDSRCDRVRLAHQSFLNRPSQHHHSRGIIRDICPHGPQFHSCCVGLELAIESKTREHFVGQLRSHLESFRLNFEQRDSRIRTQLASIFNDTTNRVNEKYSVRIGHANHELIKSVSRSVFRTHQAGSVDTHVDNLLQAIVVSEFESHVSSQRQHESQTLNTSSEYINCLSSVNFGDFFGGVRGKLVRSIHNAIETSRLILQSFHLASKLLDRSEQAQLDEKCVRQLAGNLYCSACLLGHRSDSATRPCRSTCHSIISSCVASSELAPISQAWKDLAQSLGKLVDSVVAQRNPETIFAAYPALLSEAIELARSKNEIAKKARLSCGPFDRSHQNGAGKESSILHNTEPQYPSSFSESLFVSIQSMAHLWNHHKDLFDQLQNKFCDDYPVNGCQDDRSAAPSPMAQPLVNVTATTSDEFFDSLRHYHLAVNTIQSNRLKLSNSTVYAFDEESSYNSESSDSLLHDSSGSGAGDDDEPGDDYGDEHSGEVPISPAEEPSSTVSIPTGNDLEFVTSFSIKPIENLNQEPGRGSAAVSLQSSRLLAYLLSLAAVLCSAMLRHL